MLSTHWTPTMVKKKSWCIMGECARAHIPQFVLHWDRVSFYSTPGNQKERLTKAGENKSCQECHLSPRSQSNCPRQGLQFLFGLTNDGHHPGIQLQTQLKLRMVCFKLLLSKAFRPLCHPHSF